MKHPVRPRPRAWRLCVWLGLAAALSGCGTEIVKQAQIQSNLVAAQQQAQLGRTREARQWADRAIALAPKTLSTYIAAPRSLTDNVLGIAGGDHGVFTSVGDDASVVLYMTQAVRKFPDSTLPLLILEQAQGRLGDAASQRATAAKLAALIESQLLKPGHQINADIINTLAQAYWDAGDPVKGAANYRRVIATYPRDPGVIDAENGLAYAYAVANDTAHLPEALGLAQSALSLTEKLPIPDEAKDSEIGAIEDTIGWIQYRQGKFKDALGNVQKGVNATPRLAEGRYHLAMVYKALGDVGSARIELGYAVRMSQGYADAQRELEALPASAPQKEAAGL